MLRFGRMTIFLLALNVMAFYYYGYRAIIVSLISVAVALLTEYICRTATGRKFDIKDTSPIMSAMILALLMPASIPYRIIIFASAFMIAICKYAFGGNKNLIFSPAAVAYAFSLLAWPNSVLRYPQPVPFGNIPLISDSTQVLDYSFTHYADISLSSSSYLDIIWGRLAGPMGTSCVVIIAICAISLYLFKDIHGTTLFSAVAVSVLLYVLFPLAATGWRAAVYALVTGSFMFVLGYIVCDMRYVPQRPLAQVIYGALFAAISYLLRRFSGLESAAVFSALILSIFTSEFDRFDLAVCGGASKLWRFVSGKTRDLVLYVKFRSDKKLSRDVSPSSEQGEDAGSTSADDTHKTPDTQSPDKNTDEKSSEE